jgi:molybdopterin converting factor small subunit
MTGGDRQFQARGVTLGDVLLDLGDRVPGLRVHFFDETEDIRKHIICLHGDDYVRAPEIAKRRVCEGDEVRIINALAGG